MAGTVRVEVEALVSAINDYKSRNQAFQIAYLQISNVVRTLSVNYKSEAATVFYNKFNEIYKNLSQVTDRMDGAIDKLNQVKEVYETQMATQQSLVGSLETDFAAAGNIFGD